MSGPETSERFVITADTRRRWSAKLNGLDPQMRLREVLAWIADYPVNPRRRAAAVELEAACRVFHEI